MRSLGDVREALLIKEFGSLIKVKERHVSVSQAKIFYNDALMAHFSPLHCCFCIFVLPLGVTRAFDTFGAVLCDFSWYTVN